MNEYATALHKKKERNLAKDNIGEKRAWCVRIADEVDEIKAE